MLIESIFMELRARLRSCNVYITTDVDFTKNCNLKINIKSDCIVLNYYEDFKFRSHKNSLSSIESLSDCSTGDEDEDDAISISVREFCQIIPNSISGLKIDGKNIYFRVLTESNTGGSFYKEMLSPMPAPHCNKSSVQDLKINIETKLDVILMCSNCSNVISNDKTRFNRILELPTENLDISDWFCHNHGCSSSSSKEPEIKQKRNDFLYRLTFFVVNYSVLTDKCNKFNAKRDIFHCNRCLAWLGLKTKETVKLYNSTVKINQSGESARIFLHPNGSKDADELNDFIYTVEKITNEFNIGFQYNIMCKLVLECSLASDKKQYLLIWIMDKELQVLQADVVAKSKIRLKSSVLKKILYKLETVLNEEVETWISDPAVVCAEVSKNMFVSGIQHLTRMSMKVPEYVRSTNGYTVSYLNL